MKKKTFVIKNLSVSFLKEGKRFVAYSPALDLSTSAETFEKAKERFSEIVEIFFKEINEKGTLNEVLENLGWSRRKESWLPPTVVAHESIEFKMPIYA